VTLVARRSERLTTVADELTEAYEALAEAIA
jgi:hypothetical protein